MRKVPLLGLLFLAALANAEAVDRPVQEAPGLWRAENESQRIRILFSDRGIRVVPAQPDAPSWEWAFTLSRDGRPEDLRPADFPAVRIADDQLEILRQGYTERFRNDPSGIQHVIEILPAAERGLRILDFRISGSLTPKVSEDGRSIEFRDPAAAPALAYRDLRGVDAEGRDVAVIWERLEGQRARDADLRLAVHGDDHAFPIRISGRLTTSKDSPARSIGTTSVGEEATLAVPANDACAGAEVIPGNGPFPYLSSVVDITDATTTGDPPLPSCQSNVSHSVWFSFAPVTSGDYTFSLCSDAPTATTVDDTILGIYSSSQGPGSCDGLGEMPGGCADDSCNTAQQSVLSRMALAAGITYRIVAWKFDPTAPPAGAGAVQLQVIQHPPPGPAPPNDTCGGAEIIPGSGPFPYSTLLTADMSGATIAGDPAPPSCLANVSRSIWYSFTPTVGGRYTFSDCANAPTGTTVDDTAMAIYAGVCSGLTEMPGGCDDDSCLAEAAQSVIDGIELTAGTTYHIGVWQYGTTPPAIGNTAVQMRVSHLVGPANGTCSAAIPLALDAPLSGTTVAAANDTQLPGGSGCFAGVGQTASTASGGDLAYRFTAPSAGRYSFRVTGFDTSRNAVLYVASDCPAGPAPATIAGCLGAANRNPAYPDEEVSCLSLSAGQAVYAYVDENAPTSGGSFVIEVNRCEAEAEPNGTPVSAGELACGVEGAITPAGDADFFALGVPGSGSRVFAMVDGAAGNSTDFDLRVTTGVDTFEYDDLNNDAAFGTVAPNVSGTPVDGSASYLRVSHYNATAQAEPYRLYAAVHPPAASATAESEPNDTIGTATGSPGEYYAGTLASSSDVDVFSLSAAAGELIVIQLDLDPTRDNTPFNGSLGLLSSAGASLASVNDSGSTSSTASGAGNLAANAPASPGEAIAYRIRTGGTYFAKVSWSGGTAGDYLLSVSHDCKVGPPTDLAVSQSDAPDPVLPGGSVAYAINVRNLGAYPASVVALRDDLPAGSALVSASATQGTCTGAGPVLCQLGELGAGGSAGVTVVVAAPSAPGPITNVVRASMAVRDSSPGNEIVSQTTQVGPSDSDGDGVSDPSDCAPSDATVWAVPGESNGLFFASGKTLLQWSAPSAPGGVIVLYDLLRSGSASNFLSPACVALNVTATSASDLASPLVAAYYLVRSENVCGGNLGNGSGGTPRTGGPCP
jgi:uncharacterized repeat protein (TIGR01451 family)